jgi:polar amino acid transport system substrate-binding protein
MGGVQAFGAQAQAKELQQLSACVAPAARSKLAPTGVLRLGFATAGPWVARDPATNQFRGIAVDLGSALAAQLQVTLQPVAVPNIPKLVEAGKAGDWDVAISVVTPERRALFDYSPVLMLDEATFLVPAASDMRAVADIDRTGTRIAVVRNNPTDVHLTRTIKNAELVRADNEAGSIELLKAGKADVMALARWNVRRRLEALTDYRALDEDFAAQPVALFMQKGEPSGLNCLEQFAGEALKSGLMAAAIERSGLAGLTLPARNAR